MKNFLFKLKLSIHTCFKIKIILLVFHSENRVVEVVRSTLPTTGFSQEEKVYKPKFIYKKQ